MTPREKAEELVNKFSSQTYEYQEYAGAYYSYDEIGDEAGKKCALICVDEIQEHAQMIETSYEGYANAYQFFKEVKKELEKL